MLITVKLKLYIASITSMILGQNFTLQILNLIVLFVILSLVVKKLFNLINLKNISSAKKTKFLITPLNNDKKTNLQLNKLIENIIGIENSFIRFEVNSSTKGITYSVITTDLKKDRLLNSLKAYNQYFKIDTKTITETKNIIDFELKAKKPFYFPINEITNDKELEDNYFISSMTNLELNENINFIIDAKSINYVGIEKLINQLNNNRNKRFIFPISLCINLISKVSLTFYWIVLKYFGYIFNFSPLPYLSYVTRNNFPDSLNDDEKVKIQDKLKNRLYETRIGFCLNINNNDKKRLVKKEIISSLSLFDNYYQSLKPVTVVRGNNKLIFTSKEIARFFNPSDNSVSSYDSIKLNSPLLPTPVNLRHRNNDVVIGVNPKDKSEIGLIRDERRRHMYILGSTGSGKTTLIKNMITQDIYNNKSLMIVDPHGDLAEELLLNVPKSRRKDLIYFNPSDIKEPLTINLLEQDKSLSGDDLLLEQDLICEQIISIFRKVFSEDGPGGNRLEHIFRNAIYTAFYVPESTIFTVYKLLIDKKFRLSILANIKDKTLLSFWQNEYDSAGSMQRVKLSIGITSKIGRLLRSTVTRRIIGQPISTLDIYNAMDSNKIIICNLSKGKIGEDNSSLLGSIILAKVQLAAYKRSFIKHDLRKDFYLYFDEFQNFATNSFLKMLSEGRKYGLNLVMAEQSLSQQSTNYISNILANVGTIVTFRSSSPQDEKLLLPLFIPYLEPTNLLNIPAYRFYIRIAAIKVYEPSSGVTNKLT